MTNNTGAISLSTNYRLKLLGIGFALFVALLGYQLARVPGFDRVGPLACSILIAIFYRQIWGYPEKIRAGIQFVAKRFLRGAIILFGLKLNIDIILHQGLNLLLYDVGTIVFSISLTCIFARLLGADKTLSLLLGVGTGVCGAAAIAAVSPIINAKDEDTAVGVGIIALIGTVFAVGYTIMRPIIDLTGIQYGAWAGTSLHEIAHVALAGAPAGQDALAIALLAKLGRVFLLVPLCFVLLYWMKHREDCGPENAKIEFPWFLGGFVVMSLLGSYVLGRYITLSPAAMGGIDRVTTLALTMAMVGLGLNVSLADLRTRALRPLAAMLATSVLLSTLMYAVAKAWV